MKKTTFPCPYCKGKYISYAGDEIDPPEYCGFCDDGFIVIDSEKHHRHQFDRWMENAPQFLLQDWNEQDGFYDEIFRSAINYMKEHR
jgi:hypothetical protein